MVNVRFSIFFDVKAGVIYALRRSETVKQPSENGCSDSFSCCYWTVDGRKVCFHNCIDSWQKEKS